MYETCQMFLFVQKNCKRSQREYAPSLRASDITQSSIAWQHTHRCHRMATHSPVAFFLFKSIRLKKLQSLGFPLVIKHGECWKIPYQWRFLSRKITDFCGLLSSTPYIWWHRRVESEFLPPRNPAPVKTGSFFAWYYSYGPKYQL